MLKPYYNLNREFNNWYTRRTFYSKELITVYADAKNSLSFLGENDILLEVMIKRYLEGV